MDDVDELSRSVGSAVVAIDSCTVVMPLVLRWRRWIRSGGGHGSIPGVSYLSGNITPGYSFAQSTLKGPRRQERIDSLLTGGCCWLSSNTTSSSCPRSGFWSPPSAPWFLRRFSAGFQRSLPRPTHPPSFAPFAGRLLTLLRLGGAPASIFSATLRPQTLSTAPNLWNSQEDFLSPFRYTPALRRGATPESAGPN